MEEGRLRFAEKNVAQKLDKKLLEVEERLGYQFLNPALLNRSLTHSSCKNHLDYSNERLEFLGDAVLGYIVTSYLFEAYPHDPEGELTRIKSIVVSRSSLAKAARKLGLGEYLILGKGLSRKRSLPRSLLANVFEAVLGAIYLDSGMDEARDFALRHLKEPIQNAAQEGHASNYKSLLQQHAQSVFGVTPTYRVIAEEGPDHGKYFTVVSVLGGEEHGVGNGPTKKEAEQNAAAETLEMLGVNPVTGETADPEQNGEE